MHTSVEYFGPRVKRAGIRIEQNVPFFFKAKSAFSCDRVEDSSSIYDFPCKSVRYRRIV